MNPPYERTMAGLYDLSGRVAVVTGASGWLGAPMAEGLAECGAHVWIAARRREPLDALADTLAQRGLSVSVADLDITRPGDVRALIDAIGQRHGRLDILVNNAHDGRPDGLDVDDDAAFSRAAGQSTTAVWRMIHHALDLMDAAVAVEGDASIINVSSMYGKVSPDPRVYPRTGMPPNPMFYGAAKAGIIQMTRWLATNLGPRGIRVNSLSPGAFPQRDTPQRHPDFVAALADKVPLGRIGARPEIKGPLVFLASPASTYVTGTDLAVDGGWTAW